MVINVPLPRYKRYKWKTKLLEMGRGDSYICNNYKEKQGMKMAARRLKYKVISRKLDDLPRLEASYKVWRIE